MSSKHFGSSFIVRDLELADLPEFLQLLSYLTQVDPLPEDRLHELFDERGRSGIVTKVVVDNQTGKVVGTASLLVERKFTRGGRCVGHVEDVVTNPAYRGKGVGSMLIRELCDLAEARDCYKIILDCADEMMTFYNRYGFVKCENQMRINLPRALDFPAASPVCAKHA